jgi:MFS family permease
MKSLSGVPGSDRAIVATVALTTMLSPLNTSMVPVALSELQRALDASPHAVAWLLTVFALASAVGHPVAGAVADRVGPRRVLVTGLAISSASGLAAAYVTSLWQLVVVRAVQALGASTAFPAGMSLLRSIRRRDASGAVPSAWLGAVAMSSNLSAALGPVLGGMLVAAAGWRAIFFVNLPIAAAGTVLVLRHCPGDRLLDASEESSAVESFAPGTLRALWWVYARFTAACTVFLAVFFALPLNLEQSHGLTAATAGAAMFPLVAASALATPIAVRVVSRSGFPRALAWGAGAACLGTLLLSAPGRQTPIAATGAALVAFGASHAFNNLGLQTELAEMTLPRQLGRAAGYFRPRASSEPRWPPSSWPSSLPGTPRRLICSHCGS